MPQKPKLAIVGRPNVGKSALFNRIAKKRIAIVDEAEGVTRDRIYAEADFFGTPFEVIDTAGINPRSAVPFNEQIIRQAEIAIEEADALVMVVDGLVGITALDHEVAQILLRTKKPVALAVNKIDDQNQAIRIHDFYPLGISHIVPVSATQNWQIAELLETVIPDLPPADDSEEKDYGIRVAIVGRTNVGKSSLINYILDEQRCLVSPIPGTTRDSIDALVVRDEERYTFIDTAGIRKKGSEHEAVDKFAAIRTERAIERADVCLLVLDAQQGLTAHEKRIAKMIEESGKGCIILFNKWDLVKGFRMEHCLKEIDEEIAFLKHCPKLMTSAVTGRNIEKIFEIIQDTYHGAQLRIPTPELNRFVEGAIQRNHPPMIKGKRLRIYYLAQVDIQPPRFVAFVNNTEFMADSWKRYLINQFREMYPFKGIPITFELRGKKKAHISEDDRVAD